MELLTVSETRDPTLPPGWRTSLGGVELGCPPA